MRSPDEQGYGHGADASVAGILVFWVVKADGSLHADPECPRLNIDPGGVGPWAVWSIEEVPHETVCECLH